VGRLEAFRIPGCRCWFYAGDHGPPHFHASAPDEWEIRIFFLQDPVDYEVKYAVRRIPGGVLSTLLRRAADKRAVLFREWERNQSDE